MSFSRAASTANGSTTAIRHASEQAPLVLVVDDDADVRDSLADLLGSVGIETELFATTDELLRAGIPDRPCCLILDLRLPGAGGLELQSKLAEMQERVPVIFLTGYADVSTSVRAMKAGAVDFLPKPFRDQELLDAVSAALRLDVERRSGETSLKETRRLAESLTPREIDVLGGVRRGLLNKQIAFEMGISEITVKMHRSNAGRKLKVVSVADMVRKIVLLDL
jgi:FixJ family two-component response regulator